MSKDAKKSKSGNLLGNAYGYTYLFTSYLDPDTDKPDIKNIELIPNCIGFSNNDVIANNKFFSWATNQYAQMKLINNNVTSEVNDIEEIVERSNWHISAPDIEVIFPPQDLMVASFATEGKGWGKFLAKILQNNANQTIKLKKYKLKKSELRTPKSIKKDEKLSDEELAYKKAYEKLPENQILHGYLLCKVRAVVFSFSDNVAGAEIKLWSPFSDINDQKDNLNKQKNILIQKSNQSEIYAGTFWGTKNQLPNGIYTIEVTFPKTFLNSNSVVSKNISKSKKIKFKANIQFDIKNILGEYEVVICDPTSIEQQLLTHGASHYGHLISATHEVPVDTKKIQGMKKIPTIEKGVVEKLAANIKVVHDRAKLVTGLMPSGDYNGDGLAIMTAIYDGVKTDNAWMENSIEMVFNINNYWGDARKAVNDHVLNLIESGSLTKRMVKVSDPVQFLWRLFHADYFGEKSFLKKVPGNFNQYVATQKLIQVKLPEALKKAGFFNNHYEKYAYNANKVVSPIKKGLGAMGNILTLYSTGVSVKAAWSTHHEKGKLISELDDLLDIYEMACLNESATKNMVEYIPYNDAINHIEKLRAKAVLAEVDSDDKTVAALDQCIDLSLSVLSVFPATTPVAGGLLLTKTLTEGALSLYQSVTKMLDELITEGYFTLQKKNLNLLKQIHFSSMANQIHMRESADELINDATGKQKQQGKYYLDVQYRLRSEALSGLIGLITRAGMAADNDPDMSFEDKIKDYHIEEYIQNYLLGDGWKFDLKTSSTPLSMDEYWLYAVNVHGLKNAKQEDVESQYRHFGFEKKSFLLEQIDDPNYTSKDEAQRSVIFDDMEDQEHFTTKPILGAKYNFLKLDWDLPENTTANFQSCFPIHYQQTSDVVQLCKSFQTIYSDVNPNSIEQSKIYVRPRGSIDNKDWEPMLTRLKRIDNAKEGTVDAHLVSPLEQIRILIVLDDKSQGIYPYRLQSMRKDNKNIEGAVYKGIVKPLLKDELLADEQQWLGRSGVVIYPFFQMARATIFGTKPMVGEYGTTWYQYNSSGKLSDSDTIIAYADAGHLKDMSYSWNIIVGNETDVDEPVFHDKKYYEQFYQKLFRHDVVKEFLRPAKNSWLKTMGSYDEYPVGIDIKREHSIAVVSKGQTTITKIKDEKLLIHKDFLQSRAKEITYYSLIKGNIRSHCFLRLADGRNSKNFSSEYILPHHLYRDRCASEKDFTQSNKENRIHLVGRYQNTPEDKPLNQHYKRPCNLYVKQFDWETPVEFMMVIIADDFSPENYLDVHMNPYRIPIETTLYEHNIGSGVFGYAKLDYFDVSGPKLTSHLQYLGDMAINKNGDDYKFTILDVIKNTLNVRKSSYEPYHKIIDFFNNEKALAIDMLYPEEGVMPRITSETKHVFVALFSASYRTPWGKEISTIRPFGRGSDFLEKGQYKQPFRFGFSKIQTPDESGVNIDSMPHQYIFEQPKTVNVPWNFPTQPDEKIINWLDKGAHYLQPSDNPLYMTALNKKYK